MDALDIDRWIHPQVNTCLLYSYFTFQSSLLIDSLYIVSDNMKQQLPNSDIKCDVMHVAIKMVTINAL